MDTLYIYATNFFLFFGFLMWVMIVAFAIGILTKRIVFMKDEDEPEQPS